MKLYTGPLSMFGAKAEIALHEKGIDFEPVMVPFEMKTLYQPKHPEVARINPKRQVPVLVDGDLEIFDSTQIFEYLETIKPAPALWPADAKAWARARLLEHISDEIYFPPIVRLMGLGQKPDDPATLDARRAAGPSTTTWNARWRAGTGSPVICPMPILPSTWHSSSASAGACR